MEIRENSISNALIFTSYAGGTFHWINHWNLLQFYYRFLTLKKGLLTVKIVGDIIHMNQDR
ncbi:MAG TPA: hypothetical protein VIK78_17710 [Ruminiclostridium sp.]